MALALLSHQGCAMAKAVSHLSVAVEAWGEFQASVYGISDGKSGQGTGHSISAP